VGWSVFEKIITRLDSMETIVSIIMLIGMVGVLGYLYLKLKKSK
jgi:flagellar biogenesis protein FliO